MSDRRIGAREVLVSEIAPQSDGSSRSLDAVARKVLRQSRIFPRPAGIVMKETAAWREPENECASCRLHSGKRLQPTPATRSGHRTCSAI
jgi:hypothetical protein